MTPVRLEVTTLTESISGHFVRAADPKGICLLDANGLESWPTSDLTRLGQTLRLAVPDCLFTEVLTKDDPKKQKKLLLRLRGIPFAIAASLGTHCKWEMHNRQAAGLLLHDDYSPGNPRETAAEVISDALDDFQAGKTGLDLLGDFRERVDLPGEARWESFNKSIMARISDHRVIQKAMKMRRGIQSLLEAWPCIYAHRDTLIGEDFTEFARSFQGQEDKSCGPADVAEMDYRWAVFRCFVAILLYVWVNTVANPSHFNHERLNQRTDLHYIGLLNPGMTLITMDIQMSEVAKAVSPEANIARTVSDLVGIP
jgi:hypothetical protein